MESRILTATEGIWKALNELEKAVDSVATDLITLREARAVKAALYQAAVVDVRMKKELS